MVALPRSPVAVSCPLCHESLPKGAPFHACKEYQRLTRPRAWRSLSW
ncbi:MAG TPA: hypothetical protein VNZ52_03235 [Candidatus Thermoplasmatota archaeon]|nr:hypothetical protein [Candidatus Thermoplasmatota archaeon]